MNAPGVKPARRHRIQGLIGFPPSARLGGGGALGDGAGAFSDVGALRRLELEERVVELRVEAPAADGGRVLRSARLLGIRDQDLPRQALLSGIDPDLPVDGLLGEGEMMAGHAGGLVDAQVLPVDDALHQRRVDIGVQEVREGNHDAVLVRQLVQDGVDGGGHLHGQIRVVVLVEGGQGLAVVPDGAIERVAGGVGGEPGRPLDGHAPEVRELDAWRARVDLVDGLLGLQREARRPGEERAHLLHELVGPGFDHARPGDGGGRGLRRLAFAASGACSAGVACGSPMPPAVRASVAANVAATAGRRAPSTVRLMVLPLVRNVSRRARRRLLDQGLIAQ